MMVSPSGNVTAGAWLDGSIGRIAGAESDIRWLPDFVAVLVYMSKL